MRNLLLIFTFICISSYSQTSEIFIPLDFQDAVKNGTRTLNGEPGKNYWQNNSDYSINVELLPDSSYLIGDEKITYFNNSPDSLSEIVIRLYQDISRIGSRRDWYIPENYLNDGVTLNYLMLDGDSLDISYNSRDILRSSTNLIIRLNEKISPGGRTVLKIGWEFKRSCRLPGVGERCRLIRSKSLRVRSDRPDSAFVRGNRKRRRCYQPGPVSFFEVQLFFLQYCPG